MKEFVRIDNPYTEKLNNKVLTVYRGWDDTLATDLVNHSREDYIKESTPNDADRRFSDLSAAEKWYEEKQPTVYSLYGKSLAGVIWYSKRPREDLQAEHTFAIRLYESSRGKKLAYGFMKAAHHDFVQNSENPSVWLETDVDNAPARHLYEKFGYDVVGEDDGRVTMVRRPEE